MAREIDWNEVPFGAKVRAWWNDESFDYIGKFLCYDKYDKEEPFLVFVEDSLEACWFHHCKLIEEGDIDG